MTKAERQALWETRIAEYQASGQSVREWCASHKDISPKQLWYWMRKYKKQNAVLEKSNRWLPVEVNKQTSIEQGLTLLVKVGPASIEVKPGFDPALLTQVVRVLVAIC